MKTMRVGLAVTTLTAVMATATAADRPDPAELKAVLDKGYDALAKRRVL